MERRKLIIGAAIAAGVVGIGSAAVVATAADDDATDTPITGTALDRASAAALEHTGGGTVTGTEVGDEDSYYEVEVRLPDGSSVDVQLDERFRVVDQMSDDDSAETAD